MKMWQNSNIQEWR